jgi:hypothetical protein
VGAVELRRERNALERLPGVWVDKGLALVFEVLELPCLLPSGQGAHALGRIDAVRIVREAAGAEELLGGEGEVEIAALPDPCDRDGPGVARVQTSTICSSR